MTNTIDTTTYEVSFDSDTGEWVLTIGDYEATYDCSALAYLAMQQEILADEAAITL